MSGLLGAIFGLAIIMGPLIGGAFTSNTTWRWCFYINLPIGGFVMAVRALTIKVPNSKTVTISAKEKLLQLDPLGISCLVPGVICLVLALQWGGQQYAVGFKQLHLNSTTLMVCSGTAGVSSPC